METHNTKIDNSTTASAFRPMGELSRTDYVGPCVYEDGALKRILIPGGHIDVDGDKMEYRFFIDDHQGNVRAVIDQQGNLLEANDYYPYGHPLPTSTNASIQPYKFAGKERLSQWGTASGSTSGGRSDALKGLSDFGPRWLSTATASWTVPDPMAERYPSISPYAYCTANPIRYIDPTGKDIWVLNAQGVVMNRISSEITEFQVKNGDNVEKIELSKDAIEDFFSSSQALDADGNRTSYHGFKVRGDEDATKLFEFLSTYTNVEWGQAKMGEEGIGPNFITTSHSHNHEAGMNHLIYYQLRHGYTAREFIHSHPRNTPPSKPDSVFADQNAFRFDPIPQFKVYRPGLLDARGRGTYTDFTPHLGLGFTVTLKID